VGFRDVDDEIFTSFCYPREPLDVLVDAGRPIVEEPTALLPDDDWVYSLNHWRSPRRAVWSRAPTLTNASHKCGN